MQKFLWVSVLVLGALILAPLASGEDSETEFFRIASEPVFEGASAEPVLLRYKLKDGQILRMDIGVDMDMTIQIGHEHLRIGNKMTFEAKAAVTGVDEQGNMSALVKITRFGMKMTGPTEMDFDSDHAEDADEAFKPLTAMVGVGIPCKISPIGEMLETDLEPMRLAMRRAGAAAFAEEMEKTTDKMFEGAFVQYPKEPIRAGETYESGTILEESSKIHMSYKVAKVSGDQRLALLVPIAKIEFLPGAFPGADVEVTKTRADGWILHDVERGFASAGEMRIYMKMSIQAEGESGEGEIKMIMRMKSTLGE